MLCPICLREATKTERHHVVWRVDGGTDDPVNLLDICCTCHAIITKGNKEDRLPRSTACFYHQLGEYGLTFLLKSGCKYFDEYRPEDYEPMTAGEADEASRRVGRIGYRIYINVIHGQVDWDDRWYKKVDGKVLVPTDTLILNNE